MPTRKMISALVISATVLLSPSLFAAPKSPSTPCTLHQHQVTTVRPYLERVYDGRVARERMRGAELFVVAEPALTAEWLQLSIGRHIAEMRNNPGMPNCPLAVDGVGVQVVSAGNGFWVQLVAPTQAKAEEVFRRAQWLGV